MTSNELLLLEPGDVISTDGKTATVKKILIRTHGDGSRYGIDAQWDKSNSVFTVLSGEPREGDEWAVAHLFDKVVSPA